MRYKNYEELINNLKRLNGIDKKLEGLFSYLLENVQYDYEILKLAKIQANETWDFERKADIENEAQRLNAINFFQSKYQLAPETLESIKSVYGSFYELEELKGHKIYTFIERAVSDILLHKIENPAIKDGLLTKGVCKNIAQFVFKVCTDLGIECSYVEGLSAENIHHAWNKITIDDVKFYDLTYELFIRDNHDGWGKKVMTGSWLGVTLEQMQQLQPARCVYLEIPNNIKLTRV